MASTRTIPLVSVPPSTKKINLLNPRNLSFQRPEEEHVSLSSLDTSFTSRSYASKLDSCTCPYLGKQIHGHAFRTGLRRDVFVETKLLQMYARCDCFEDADQMFDEMRVKTLHAWTAIFSVYVEVGLFHEAFTLFLEFYCEDHELDFFVFPVIFKICSGIGSPGLARQFHGIVSKSSRFAENIYVCNALIDVYGKCGILGDAKRVFAKMERRDRVTWNSILAACSSNGMVFEALDFMERMSSDESSSFEPNVVTWSAILGGFSKNGYDEEAVSVLYKMKLKGIEPNSRTLASVLPSCARLRRLKLGKEIHGYITRNGLISNPILVNGLVDMYRRSGDMRNASKVFCRFSMKNVVSCNAMIVGYCEKGEISEARALFDRMGLKKDVISWNALISGHVENRLFDEALHLFEELLEEGIKPDSFTLGSVLAACSDGESLKRGKEIHSRAIKTGFQSNPFVGGALVELYSRSRDFSNATKAFDEVVERDVTTWNTLISNYSRSGSRAEEITKLLLKMREDGFNPNVYTWNGILAGHVENNHLDSAMQLFTEMQGSNWRPDIFTVGIMLQACSRSGTVHKGKQVHGHSVRNGYDSDSYIGAAIVDMYSKSGTSILALRAYKRISKPDLVSRNAMLSAFSMHGHGEEGIAFFRRILEEGFRPDSVTFLAALSSCVHLGSVQAGFDLLDLMKFYNAKPTLKHYTCIVDLLSRANRLNEAYEFTKSLPMEPDSVLWGALLGGCVIHGDLELGKIAAKKLTELEPDNTANYVLLSNLYGSAKKWDEQSRLRQLLKDRAMRKSPGCSWIEDKDDVHTFLVSDKSHERSKEIYNTLDNLTTHMKSVRTKN